MLLQVWLSLGPNSVPWACVRVSSPWRKPTGRTVTSIKEKRNIRSQSYLTNHCVTLVHKPRFLHHWGQRVPRRTVTLICEFIWATFLLCSLQSFIFCFTEQDSLCLHLIYTNVAIFLFCDNRKVPSILSPAFGWLWLKAQEDPLCGWIYDITSADGPASAIFDRHLPCFRWWFPSFHAVNSSFWWISLLKKKEAKSLHTVPSPLLHLKSSCYVCKMIQTNKQTKKSHHHDLHQSKPQPSSISAPARALIHLTDRNKSFLTRMCVPRYNSISRPGALYLQTQLAPDDAGWACHKRSQQSANGLSRKMASIKWHGFML